MFVTKKNMNWSTWEMD